MSLPQVFRGDLAPVLDGETQLGGARVLDVVGSEPEVELADGRHATARMALAFPYVPVIGDELLVIGKADRHFVIGVLRAGGETTLQFPGDVTLRSERDLHLEADEGIELSAAEIDVRVGTMRVVADTVVESAREFYQRVRDLWSVHAGEKNEQVMGEWSSRSEKASITTAEDVSVNGKEIRLG